MRGSSTRRIGIVGALVAALTLGPIGLANATTGGDSPTDDSATTNAGGGTATSTFAIRPSSQSRMSVAPQVASASTYTLTFDEFPVGSMISDQYQSIGVVFSGTLPFITTDSANPTSPVLSGTPRFQGDIDGRFTTSSGAQRTVDSFTFDVGYIDNPGAVVVQLFDLNGGQLTSVPVDSAGIVHVVVNYPNVGSFRITATGYEAAGWAIDNLSFSGYGVESDKYVAMGDSYQSGEGAYNYLPGTNINGVNQCHRSTNAYPELLVDRGVVNLDLRFRACSGAKMGDLSLDSKPGGAPWNDGSQYAALGPDTKLVTIGIVGNDLGFSPIVQSCVTRAFYLWGRPCYSDHGDEVIQKLASLRDGDIHDQLLAVYRNVRRLAPFARVVVVSYPEFLPTSKDGYNQNQWLGFATCGGVQWTDGLWIDDAVKKADKSIGETAAAAGFDFVNIADIMNGHEMCSKTPGINGIIGAGDSESFHPNKLGHSLIADRIQQAILTSPVYPSFPILPNQTITKQIAVTGDTLYITANWPGSDVKVALQSPSGVRYDRANPNGAEHGNGPTSEYFTVNHPESGQWTLEFFGADVSPAGEPVTLSVVDHQRPPAPLNASIAVAGTGSARTFDGTSSAAPNGPLTYEWDFGDGTSGTGPTVAHTFTKPGDHYVALRVSDATGDSAYAVLDSSVHIDGDPMNLQYHRVGGDLHLTNTTVVRGDLLVDGSLQCDANARVEGNVVVTGRAQLSTNCAVTGGLWVAGDLQMTATARVSGDVQVKGAISYQSTARVGGNMTAGGDLTVIDGRTLPQLHSSGSVGGEATSLGYVVDLTVPPAGQLVVPARTATWAQFMNNTAAAAHAPSTSVALSSTPGCTMAPWASNVNTPVVTINTNTTVDATTATSSCRTISLQQMTLALSADLNLVVDNLAVVNGLKVVSTDGKPHNLSIYSGGAPSSTSGDVNLGSGSTTDTRISVSILAAGKVSAGTGTRLRGIVRTGGLAATGDAVIGY